ncbi:MAG: GerW family sporulation protein [Lachnospiraceae bacterium]|nr:GerW family sporulation protein [Lachnospiraceae bacterium]
MADNKFDGLVNSLMEGMDGFLSTKTVVGDPTQVGDTIIIPLVDVSFGVGAGAAIGEKKNGGMGALSGKMTPSAVLVISNGHTRLVNIKNQDSITKLIDLVPDVLDRLSVKKNKDGVTDANAVETAFPKEEEK